MADGRWDLIWHLKVSRRFLTAQAYFSKYLLDHLMGSSGPLFIYFSIIIKVRKNKK
jgi:hypothetical protein